VDGGDRPQQLQGALCKGASLNPAPLEVWAMKADPKFGDIYILFRDRDYGREPVPGAWVDVNYGERREFKTIDAALDYIRNLHDQRLKGTSE